MRAQRRRFLRAHERPNHALRWPLTSSSLVVVVQIK
jgi:hypothetical protein